MNTEIQALQTRLEAVEARCAQSETQYRKAQNRLRIQAGLAFTVLVAAILVSPANRAALAQGYGSTLVTVTARLTALETKTQFLSIGGDGEMHIVGTNLHIENGLGATNGFPTSPSSDQPGQVKTNGLGNLIIGYNDSGISVGRTDVRTGSHNLILGSFQNYTSYGGLVAGTLNTISGPYASVSGGRACVASGEFASISGGSNSAATNQFSSVSGGLRNTASGPYACVSGGNINTASGFASAVSGGVTVTQAAGDGWAAGGTGAGTFNAQ